MCRLLGVSRSGFHAWQRRPPSDRALADAWLGDRIAAIHQESRGTYGARGIHAALRQRGIRVGRKRVERRMRAQRLRGAVPQAGAGLIHHSDQGKQYVSLLVGERCRDAGIDISIGCTSAYDNAVAESFFASLTKDLLRRQQP
jgi:transposase InsO family protein